MFLFSPVLFWINKNEQASFKIKRTPVDSNWRSCGPRQAGGPLCGAGPEGANIPAVSSSGHVTAGQAASGQSTSGREIRTFRRSAITGT